MKCFVFNLSSDESDNIELLAAHENTYFEVHAQILNQAEQGCSVVQGVLGSTPTQTAEAGLLRAGARDEEDDTCYDRGITFRLKYFVNDGAP